MKSAAIIRHSMLNRLVIYLCISAIGLIGCQQEIPSDPACRVKEQEKPKTIANAACIIRLDDQLLTVTHRMTGRFDVPGGTTDMSESSQCTAHREVWEETGFNVEVGEWLATSTQGMRFYSCKLAGHFDGELQTFPVPPWSTTEIDEIQLLDPFAISDKDWRFPNQLPLIRDMFNQVEDSAQPSKKHPAEELLPRPVPES